MAGYQTRVIDMTPFVAGGFGANQRIFQNAVFSAAQATTAVAQTQAAPCAFLVTGSGDAGGSTNGVETHDVIVRVRVRLSDFIGTQYIANGPGVEQKWQLPLDAARPVPGSAIMLAMNSGAGYIARPIVSDGGDHLQVGGDASNPVPVDLKPTQANTVPVNVKVVPDMKDAEIPPPPQLLRHPIRSPFPLESDLRVAAKSLGFVLVSKSDVNAPPPIKDDHFDKPTKS
jgi:hypothetical protein